MKKNYKSQFEKLYNLGFGKRVLNFSTYKSGAPVPKSNTIKLKNRKRIVLYPFLSDEQGRLVKKE